MTDPARDELELRRLVEAYGVAVDDGDPGALAELFVSDGVLLVYEAGSDELRFAYRDARFEPLTEDLSRAYVRTFHLVANAVITIEGDTATGTVYCLASHLRDVGRGAQVGTMPVRYRDRYIRTAAGWRFAERVATILWRDRRPAVWPPSGADAGGLNE